jgi:hypothetical protein
MSESGSAIPPYDGRRERADVDPAEEGRKEGANVGGATGPVESKEMKAPEPDETARGAHASPADEQPAAESRGDAPAEDEGVGPAHVLGTPRGEEGGA